MPKSVLILCPHLSERGGVAHYYSLVNKHFRSDTVDVSFFPVGRCGSAPGLARRVYTGILDATSLLARFKRHDLIVINPSFDVKSLVRDGIYHILAKRVFNKKTMVFFRGWNEETTNFVNRKCRSLIRLVFNPDKCLVLSRHYRDLLISWGYCPHSIILETTTYEETGEETHTNYANLMYLSRFAEGKGCFTAVKTVEILATEFPDIKLYMVGDGPLLPQLRQYVSSRGLEETILFTGWLEQEKKSQVLNRCGIMLFPTSYGEGMPNSILEGMGAGLVIVSRPVAAIPEIIIERENGFLVPSCEPEDFARKIRQLLNNNAACETISSNNRLKAKTNYEIRTVVTRLNGYFRDVLA